MTRAPKRLYTFVLLFILSLAACQPGDLAFLPPPSEAPVTPTAAPLPTTTRVWFPASATPSPRPAVVQTPTPDWFASVGRISATDDFSRAELWDTAVSDQGSATVRNGQLTLAVQPGVYLISLQKENLLSDFYAEITARPSLCKGEDSYGLLARANAFTYYRFAVVCNGTVRAERVSVNQRSVLYPPGPSGDAPPGAPAEVRIGVWAVGREMRFFLNDHYQFTILDTNLAAGTLGIFARSSGSTPVTVSFSDLVVKTVSYISPTPSLTPTRTPIPTVPTIRK